MKTLKIVLSLLAFLSLSNCAHDKVDPWYPKIYVIEDGSLHRESEHISCVEESMTDFVAMKKADLEYLYSQCLQTKEKPWYDFWE